MDQFSTLPAMIQYALNTFRNSYALNDRVNGEWVGMSTEVFVEKIRRLSLGLRALGLKRGDTVGLLSRPSPYWLIADLAITVAGGISVPIFPHISEKNFLYQVKNASLKYFITLGGEHWPAISPHQGRFSKVVTMNIDLTAEGENVIDLQDVLRLGDALSQENPSLYAEMRDSLHKDDLATIVYTSGSTGIPKGVELTHANIISQLKACSLTYPLDPRTDRMLSLLPLAHMFERMLVYYYISSGVSVYFVDDLKNLTVICQEVKPTISAMVPLIIEKVYSRILAKVESEPFFNRWVGKWALSLAHRNPDDLLFRMGRPLAKWLVYDKVANTLGGNFRAIIVGGAPLSEELCRFFWNVGVPLYQGYGLTETAPVLATNYPDNNKPGTVGKAFPGTEVKITPEGEIIAKGPNVMRGYHGDPEGTRAIIDDEGWIHTGDKGSIDQHGFISITGRFKEIMKTSGGKMVSPVPIEQALCEAPFIDMAMVVANDRKFVTCVLFPNFEMITSWKNEHNMSHLSLDAFLDSPYMKKQVETVIANVNAHLNEWEKLRAYRFVTKPLSVGEGELTPTFKINRDLVASRYSNLIDSMY